MGSEKIFPNLGKEIVIQVQAALRTPNRQNQKRTFPKHIIVKVLSTWNKERILKAAREKHQVTYKGKPKIPRWQLEGGSRKHAS
jgi:hypothetical protein